MAEFSLRHSGAHDMRTRNPEWRVYSARLLVLLNNIGMTE